MFSFIVLYLLVGAILNEPWIFVASLQCYQCEFGDLPVNQSINPTLDAFQSFVPSQCRANFSTATNLKYCYINFYITTYTNSSIPRPQFFIKLGGSKSNSDLYYVSGQDAVQLVMAMFSHNVSLMNIFHRRVDYLCHTDQCNSVENIKSVLRATIIDLDYGTVMNRLSVPLYLEEHPLQCSNYSNITSSKFGVSCSRCRYNYYPPPSPTSACRRCETISCNDKEFCGSCSMYVDSTDEQGGYTIASISHVEVHYLNRKNSLRGMSYYCNTPNCNSLQNRAQVLSSYNFTFDMNAYEYGINLSSTTMTTTTTTTATHSPVTSISTTVCTATKTNTVASISSTSAAILNTTLFTTPTSVSSSSKPTSTTTLTSTSASVSSSSKPTSNTTLTSTSASVSSSSESTSTTASTHSLASTSVNVQTTTNGIVQSFVQTKTFILNVSVLLLTKLFTA